MSFGLRPRLLLALVATSAITLGTAALALFSPLRERLREESVSNLRATVLAARPSFDRALRRQPDCGRVLLLAGTLESRTNARAEVVDIVPNIVCGTGIEPPAQALEVQAALNERRVRTRVLDEEVRMAAPLARARGGQPRYVLYVRKPLRDVAEAVDTVRSAFLTAALAGLAVSLVFGLAFATTLLRRLGRLRGAARRITDEGPGAPPPRDTGGDEIGDLARALAAMQEALRRQEDARRAFVATASHELRTPLTSLQGMLELLDEDLRSGALDVADAQVQVAAAQGELRRLGNLATELLDLSRLDAGVRLRREPVELAEVCRAVAAEFELRAREHGVRIRFSPPPGPVWAGGDPGAVARILRILIDNALRFCPAGETITLACGYRGDRAHLEVADPGPGVPADERELVFDRFQRGSRTGGEGGFGLGLAIGRELASRLGGSLELDPAAAGARFFCELPIDLPAGGPGEDPAAAAPLAESRPRA